MYKLKDTLLFDDINSSHSFLLWYSHLFHGSTWAIRYVRGTVSISQKLLQPSIIAGSLWLIRENLGTVFILGKQCSPALLKMPIYSTELVAVIFLCSHPMVNVLIWQIRFYWFELAAIQRICFENVFTLSSQNNQSQG